MAAFLDVCRFNPTAGGTTDWTFSSAVAGYQSPTLASVVNGRAYKFRAESADLSQWEISEGAYNSGTGVFARTAVFYNSSGTGIGAGQSGAGTKINFSTVPQVAIVAMKEDLISIEEANSFTGAQKDQARVNILAAGVVRKQIFAGSGTYTPDPNLLYCIIECVGGGGGSGGIAGSTGSAAGAGGGGGGGYSRLVASAATIGPSKSITIGAAGSAGTSGNSTGGNGGDTSVGTLCIGKGGTGAGGANSGSLSPGAAGGVAGTGDFTIPGSPGHPGFLASLTTVFPPGGNGGGGPFGAGGVGVAAAGGVTAVGGAGQNYGGGGGGGAFQNVASNNVGAAGGPGVVFITEICSK